ncbi:MAG: hypothetical protein D3909_06990 [Candidatus Electrothrix sp. ATG1]|nr:hypothetical protein [Candidatus Electrothrix sp. ATG1]
MSTLNRLVIFIFLLFLLSPSLAGAWDDKKTHPTLTLQAIRNTKDVKDVLTSQLGFEKNFDEKLYNGNDTFTITKWLTEGSHLEDVPTCRAANHFHNPWELWKDSMLTDPPHNGGSSHHA